MPERVRAGRPGDNVTDATRVEALGDCTASYVVVSELSEQLKTARAEHSNRLKKWKGRGLVVEALKKAIKDRFLDPYEVLAELHEYTRLRALQNMPTIQRDLAEMWSDLDIDAQQQEEIQRQRWRDDGSFAGRQGSPRDANPHETATEAWQAWDRGWLEDQERIARSMGSGGAPLDTARAPRRKRANGSTPAHEPEVTQVVTRKRRRAAGDDAPAAA